MTMSIFSIVGSATNRTHGNKPVASKSEQLESKT
jgi:hypothetical protein